MTLIVLITSHDGQMCVYKGEICRKEEGQEKRQAGCRL